MKNRSIALLSILGFHAAFFAVALCLPSCQSGGQINEARLARLARIGDVALAYAERTGKISPEDAALAREAGKLVLTPSPAPMAETATK
jgi:hypothetical protein